MTNLPANYNLFLSWYIQSITWAYWLMVYWLMTSLPVVYLFNLPPLLANDLPVNGLPANNLLANNLLGNILTDKSTGWQSTG
jgi:hypothetical protein